ncbi:hypothetical protein [Paludibaculum fermentans]|uniref:Uncharacterized protein n=1 Tax=Paludibaculum fermentans TaxID=1473598 RepID=A0A7S7NNA1_PALFE|nr:hypothetical protein [Paludibaculum fermentans]QOY86762.1 hypothetical protein IRI77_28855 [Paludibaculum fermentans]
MTDLCHPGRLRPFRVWKPEILPERMAIELFGSKQILSFWLFILSMRGLASRASKIGRPHWDLFEWSMFLLACTAASYATALSITATIGALKAVGWKPAWAILGLICALNWVALAATALVSTAPFPHTSLGVRLIEGGAIAGYFGYAVLSVLLWAEIESRKSA